jgi:hypothetical protein
MALFQRANKASQRLRLALIGPSGSGKTYTALSIASHLGSKIAVIDTERGSSELYSDVFNFDVLKLSSFSPDRYIEGLNAAADAGYDVLVIDSLSHAWMGKDGVLEFKDRVGGDFNAWRKATPLHNKLVDAILDSPLHTIITMRSKVEYVMEEYEDNGRKKTRPRKIGMQPVQREGLDYEMTITADLDLNNNLAIDKTRCSAIKGKVYHQAGADFVADVKTWLESGDPIPELRQQLRATYKAARDRGAEVPALTADDVNQMSADDLRTKIKELGKLKARAAA